MYDSLQVNFYAWCEIMIKAHFFSFCLSNCPSMSCWKDYHFPIILSPFLRSVDNQYEYLQPLTVWIAKNCGKFFKRWEYQTAWHASWEICMQIKKQQLELNMDQWTGSKLGKKYIKAVYYHPAYLTYMQSESESEVTQSCPTLCDPMNCSLPGSSVHRVFQVRVLEWVAISFSRRPSWPRDRTQISWIVGRW